MSETRAESFANRGGSQWRIGLTLASLALLGVAGSMAWRGAHAYPKRFDVVDPGRVYRSGEVRPEQLERLAQEREIRSVLSMLNPSAPESVAERAAAERLGLRWQNIPLTGDGASTPQDREQIRDFLCDQRNQPVLIHCAAGVNRTGLAVGMYRLHVQGWTLEQVERELLSTDFENEPHHANLREALRTESEWPKP